MKRIYQTNIYLVLLPLLLLYFLVIYLFSSNNIQGDEIRYLQYVSNLLHGFYTQKGPDWAIVNGPGYPLFLVPFIWLKVPLIFIRLFNGLFLYFSLIFIFKLCNLYFERKKSINVTLIISVVLLIYNKHMIYLYTESLTILLLSAFIYLFCLFIKKPEFKLWQLIKISAILTILCLTKCIFGYVVMVSALFTLVLFLFLKNKAYIRASLILVTSLFLSLPYLIYTYNISHKLFFWGGSNDTLYWMSTPSNNEYGDWIFINTIHPEIYKNHKQFIDSLKELPNSKQEEAFFNATIKNIKTHPGKYALNWYNNLERLVFGKPYTYVYEKPDYRIFISSFIFTFLILSLIIFIIKIKKYPEELLIILMMFAVYLGGTSLASAEVRQFYILFPFLIFWGSYGILNFVRIKIIS